ncbi:hypothetical protein EPO04_03275 [Patescibacteria group bacterium]|nr:MAG: hypothetical protein EPO04_03275 [Patescibacteria group bacterium]
MRKLCYIFICIITLLTVPMQAFAAESISDEDSVFYGAEWYDPNGTCSGSGSAVFGPGTLPSSVPEPYNRIFTAAARKFNISAAFLAAVFYGGEHGNSFPEPPPPYGHGAPWATSWAAAQGPFQFLESTWRSYKVDGNGDGREDIQDLTDGAFGGAKYLAALGAKNTTSEAKLRKAAADYNGIHDPSASYPSNVWAAYQKFSTGSPSPSATSSPSGATPDPTGGGEGSVYILGDSLMVGSYYEGNKYLKGFLDTKNINAYVDASVGRGIKSGGSDPSNNRPAAEKSGIDAVEIDKDVIKDAGTIVIELGTNKSSSTNAFKQDMKDLINKVKSINGDAKIYWVNIVSENDSDYTTYNTIIEQVTSDENIYFIDEKSKNINLDGSKLHPTDDGYKKYSQTIADAVGAAGSQNAAECTSTGGVGASGYKNPLRDIRGLTRMRIDMGVDYGGSGPFYAIGNGKVVSATTSSGWPGGNWVSYQLTDGPAKDKYVYVAENCSIKVSVGDEVTSDTVLCELHDSYPYSETGWAVPPDQGTTAAAHNVYVEGDVTAYGVNFSDLMKSIGAPPGVGNRNAAVGSLPDGWPSWR